MHSPICCPQHSLPPWILVDPASWAGQGPGISPRVDKAIPCPISRSSRSCAGGTKEPRSSPARSQGGEPLCILNIGLTTGDLFDVAGVHDLGLDPHLFQGRIGTLPVDPGALHDHRIGPMGGTPQGQCLPVLLKSTKLPALNRNVSVRVRENGTGGDLGLMNIQADNPVKEGLQFHNDVSPITIKGRDGEYQCRNHQPVASLRRPF